MRAGDRVAVAVSGGADSVALLRLLLELRTELGIVLSVVHVNHKLRGEESDEDERFVRELAQRHALEMHVRSAPVSHISKGGSESASGIEAAARALRYDFFRDLASAGEVSKIATAHTLDDQAETVLLRIFRGTGIRGLAGIHPRIVFEERGRVFGELVRPLLGLRRAALQEFLREQGQGWREDSSNRDIAFLRNRVRHNLLPVIAEELGDAAIEHMSELAEIARAEEEHWEFAHPELTAYLVSALQLSSAPEQIAEQIPEQIAQKSGFVSGHRFSDAVNALNPEAPLGAARGRPMPPRQSASLPVAPLLALPLAAQRRLLRAWLEGNAPNLGISFRLIEEALELARTQPGKKLELGGASLRLARRGKLRELLLELELSAGTERPDYEYPLALPGAVDVPELGARVEARIVDVNTVPEAAHGQLLEIERMSKQVVVIRNWRAGDRYWPAHTAAAKKVKDLLSDRQVTGPEKKLWPVAVAEGCGLIWMRGFAVPAAFRASAGVSKAIWIREIASIR